MNRKSINLTQEGDIRKWRKIKKQEINRLNNPDLGDVELLRKMMDVYVDDEGDRNTCH